MSQKLTKTDETPKLYSPAAFSRLIAEIERLTAERDALEKSLCIISQFDGMTLLGDDGATHAFEQCAGIAKTALKALQGGET